MSNTCSETSCGREGRVHSKVKKKIFCFFTFFDDTPALIYLFSNHPLSSRPNTLPTKASILSFSRHRSRRRSTRRKWYVGSGSSGPFFYNSLVSSSRSLVFLHIFSFASSPFSNICVFPSSLSISSPKQPLTLS